MTEGKKASRARKSRTTPSPPPLSSRSGSATVYLFHEKVARIIFEIIFLTFPNRPIAIKQRKEVLFIINKYYYNVNLIMIMFYSAHIDVIDLKFLIRFK